MRALLAGYYGMNNTGDDSLLAVATWGLRSYLRPETVYATIANHPIFMPFRSIKPIYDTRRNIKGRDRIAGWMTAQRSRTIVFGGGSVFHSLRDLKQKMEMLRISGRGPHFAIGVSLGPFSTTEAERYCVEVLKRLAFVGLRDQDSADFMQSMSADINFTKTFDLAPLLPRCYHSTIDRAMARNGQRSGIGIALCDYERFVGGNTRQETTRRKKIIDTIKAIPKSLSDEIVLIDFNGHPNHGDAPIHAEIGRELAGDVKVRHVPYIGNPLPVLNTIGKLRLIVAMRLHAAVFGYMTGTPTIMLSYHPKCRGWASEIRLVDRFVIDSTHFEVDQLRQLIEERLNGNNCETLLEFAEAEQRALLNFTLLGGLKTGEMLAVNTFLGMYEPR